MPNWYTTRVEVSGSEADIKAFKAKHLKPNDFLNTFIPMPEIYKHINASSDVGHGVKALQGSPVQAWTFIAKNQGNETLAQARMSIQAMKDHGHPDWYHWRNEHWGVKWDANEFDMGSEGPTHLQFMFNTPWGPARPVLAKMREMWPKLDFKIEGHGEEDYEYDEETEEMGDPIWSPL